MAMPQHKNPCPGGQDLQFCSPYLAQYYYTLYLSDLSLGEDRKIFKEEIMHSFSPYELYGYLYGKLLSIFL